MLSPEPDSALQDVDVLVCEDDADLREMLRHVLEKHGCSVRTAGDGRQALRAVEKRRPALVLTDIVMPEMEGLETIIELRRTLPGLKIIAMSGAQMVRPDAYLQMAQHLGADAVFQKPIDIQVLIDKMKDVLSS